MPVFPLYAHELLSEHHAANKSPVAYEIVTIKQRAKVLEEFPALLNISDVQEILGVGRNTAYSLVRSGKIKHLRIGRLIKVPKAELEAYLHTY